MSRLSPELSRASPAHHQVESLANVTEVHEALNFVPRRESAGGGAGDDEDSHWGSFGERRRVVLGTTFAARGAPTARRPSHLGPEPGLQWAAHPPAHGVTHGHPVPPAGIWSVAWSPGGGELIAGWCLGKVARMRLVVACLLAPQAAPLRPKRLPAASKPGPHATSLLTGSLPSSVSSVPAPQAPTAARAQRPHSLTLAATFCSSLPPGTNDRSVNVYDFEVKRTVARLVGHADDVNAGECRTAGARGPLGLGGAATATVLAWARPGLAWPVTSLPCPSPTLDCVSHLAQRPPTRRGPCPCAQCAMWTTAAPTSSRQAATIQPSRQERAACRALLI